MEDQDIRHPLDCDEPAEAAEEPQEGAQRFKIRTVRIGWFVCAAGFLITMIATSQLAVSDGLDRGGPQSLRAFGLIVMLFGAAIVLGGFRKPWLLGLLRSLQGLAIQRHGGSQAPQVAAGHHKSSYGLIITVGTSFGFWVISWFVAFVCPDTISGLYLITMTLLLTAAAIVVVSGGNRLQRFFCIGALIPLVMAAFHIWILLISSGPLSRRPRVSTMDSQWEVFVVQLKVLQETIAILGHGMRVFILVAWLGALLLGISTLMVRLLLYHINREAEDSTS